MSFGFARRASDCRWIPTASTPASTIRSATSPACAAGPWCGTMMSEKTSRGNSEPERLNSSRGADRLRRIYAGESEEIKDVAAAGVDAARLAATAVHGLHVCQQESIGKPLAEGGNDIRNALGLEQRRSHFDDVDSTRQRRTGDRQTQIQDPHIDRNLKREAGLEPIHNAGGTRVCLLRRLLAPGGTGPYRLEDGAAGQPAAGEPTSDVEERSPVEAPVVIRHLLTIHDRSSSEGWTLGGKP